MKAREGVYNACFKSNYKTWQRKTKIQRQSKCLYFTNKKAIIDDVNDIAQCLGLFFQLLSPK